MDEAPAVTEAGLAEMETVGGGTDTVPAFVPQPARGSRQEKPRKTEAAAIERAPEATQRRIGITKSFGASPPVAA
jgi:hypothetical protein